MPNEISNVEVIEQVTEAIRGFSANASKEFEKMRAQQAANGEQIAQIEQMVVRGGGSLAVATAPITVGASAMERLRGDSAFESASASAARGMKPSRFDARIDLDNSIRAALTNTGRGTATDTAYPTPVERGGAYTPPQRPLRLLDVLPHRPTTSDAVEFIQIKATGDAAEQIHEGDEKAEIEVEGTLQTANIVTIAAHTTASKQVLADNAALSQQIDAVIDNKVLSRLENQLINGPGGQGRINGLINQATMFVPTIAKTPADTVGEALVTQSNNGYQPKLVLMNPRDWFRIQLTRKNANDDEYVFGSPTVPVPPSLWNTVIVTTPSIAEGTAMILDTSFVTVLDREQVSVAVSNSHLDYFTRNLVAILGELRAGLEVIDTNALYKFSLLTTTS